MNRSHVHRDGHARDDRLTTVNTGDLVAELRRRELLPVIFSARHVPDWVDLSARAKARWFRDACERLEPLILSHGRGAIGSIAVMDDLPTV